MESAPEDHTLRGRVPNSQHTVPVPLTSDPESKRQGRPAQTAPRAPLPSVQNTNSQRKALNRSITNVPCISGIVAPCISAGSPGALRSSWCGDCVPRSLPIKSAQPHEAQACPQPPAGPLRSLGVQELRRADAILFVQLLVLPGGHAGLLGQRRFLGCPALGDHAGLDGLLLGGRPHHPGQHVVLLP